ncbi:MAG: hypothetical protein ABIE07_02885 [Candidatus Zixiibacteriota bacterium]
MTKNVNLSKQTHFRSFAQVLSLPWRSDEPIAGLLRDSRKQAFA